MKMKTSLLLLLWLVQSVSYSQEISVDDLLPPAMGGTTEIQSPSDVRVEEGMVTAATAQDAVNAAVQEAKEDFKEAPKSSSTDEVPSVGATWIKFGSGWGVVSTGFANYRELASPTSGLIAQRNAFVVAYTSAKADLAKTLAGATSEGTTEYQRFKELSSSNDTTDQKGGDVTTEMIRQSANKVLKGYVTYQWNEMIDEKDPTVHTVYVTLAVTPKTMTASQRTGLVDQVDKLQDGLQTLLSEIKSGLVPPVGGRVVTVGETGQTAVIGFGSAVVAKADDRLLELRNKVDAQKIADARAMDALVGILSGDQTIWSTGVASSNSQEFAQSAKYVIDQSKANTAIETVTAAKQTFLANRSIEEAITSTRTGALPPGTSKKGWTSDDGNWANTIIIYYPDMTAVAQQFVKEMDAADLLSGARDPQASGSTTSGRSQSTSAGGNNGKEVDTRVPTLSGGKLDQDDL